MFVDNDGVMYSTIRGASKCHESNLIVAHFWLAVARRAAHVSVWRVTSESNISDGPSRGDFKVLQTLLGTSVVPVIPDWLRNFYVFAWEDTPAV